MSRIKINRTIKDFHVEVKEICARKEQQSKEITHCKRELLEMVKNLQVISYQSIVRSGYFMRMTSSNYKQILSLPFMSKEGISVYDRLVEIPNISSFRSCVPRFIRAFYKCLPDLPELLATIPPKDFGLQPFLPENMKLCDFISCSTFPSLFGHLYTSELKMCYINFLVGIAKNLPKEAFDNFREHWLYDCIKTYIHSSNIQLFLRRSLGDLVLKVMRDKGLVKYVIQKENQKLFKKITTIVKAMITKMEENFCVFPDDVRYLINSFSETATDEETKLKRIELIFVDAILAPAISLPKTYGVLPKTMYFDVSPFGPARVLQLIAQSFRFILHPAQAETRYPDVDFKGLSEIPLKEFLLSTPLNTLHVTGLKLQEIIDVLNVYNVITFYSIPDIVSLAFMVKKLSLTKRPEQQELFKESQGIPTEESVPFDYFRYEHFGLGDFNLVNPRIKEPKVNTMLESSSAKTADALYNLVLNLKCKEDEPAELLEFIRYHQREREIEEDHQSLTHIQHFVCMNKGINDNEDDIITSLEEILRRQRKFIKDNEQIVEKTAEQLIAVKKETERYTSSRDEWLPIYYSVLLDLFITNNHGFSKELKEKKQDMLIVRSVFDKFFESNLRKLKDFLQPIDPEAYPQVACCLHSLLMVRLSFTEFRVQHSSYSIIDEKYSKSKKELIERICYKDVSNKIKKMLDFPPLFNFAIQEINKAGVKETPIEVVYCFSRAIELLRKAFELEIGGLPQADDINPLLSYTIMSSFIQCIYTFGKYIDFYLNSSIDPELKFLDDSFYATIAQFNSQFHEIERILATITIDSSEDKSN